MAIFLALPVQPTLQIRDSGSNPRTLRDNANDPVCISDIDVGRCGLPYSTRGPSETFANPWR